MKKTSIKKDPGQIFMENNTLDVAKILSKSGLPDDIYDVQQGFIPFKPLIMTFIATIGFVVSIAQKTPLGLLSSMGFLFLGSLGLYHLLVGSKYKETSLRRSELMHMAEAIAELKEKKNNRNMDQ